jgi:hypothetical protein
MRSRWLFLLCLFLPSLGRAHELTVRPLRIELKCDSRKVRVTVSAHMLYWMEDILGVRLLPASRWPEDMRRKAKDYIDSHFSLAVNGERLQIDLADCRYIEDFWNVRSGGTIVFQLTYPLPARFSGGLPPGSSLSGRASFYSEVLEDLREIRNPAEAEREGRWFRTDLFILGRVRRHFVLTPGSADFNAPWDESLQTFSGTAGEFLRQGLEWIFVRFALALLILAAVLRLAADRAAGWGSFLFPAIFTASFLAAPVILGAEKLLWVFVLGLAAAAWFRFPLLPWRIFLGACALVSGAVVSNAPPLWEAPPEHLLVARWFFLAGVMMSGVILAAVFYGLLVLYRRRFQRVYASVWEKVFLSHIRFLSQVLVAVSAYFLFYDLIGRSG